ncbi:MAG TPA: MFS transporter [Victivallales bacterium]|nr:MFS transporter [Victivallales bacterium]
MTNTNVKISLFPLIMAVSLAVLNTALISPALPAMRTFYSISVNQAQFIILTFIVGYSISQLLSGSLANIYGYRTFLITSIALGVFGTAMCILSYYTYSYSIMIIGRFINGLGVSAGLVLAFAVINHFFKGKKATVSITYCQISLALVPAFSNMIGGYLTYHFGFISCFYFLFIYNTLSCILCFKLHKSIDKDKTGYFSITTIVSELSSAFKNKKVVSNSFLYGLSLSLIYGCIITLPFIGIDYLKLNEEIYGTLFFCSYLGYFTGCLIIIFTHHKIKELNFIMIGNIISIAGGIVLFLSIISGYNSVALIFSSIFTVLLGVPFVFVSTISLGISSHHNKANASSVFNFIYAVFTVSILFMLTFTKGSLLLVVPLGIILLMVVSMIFFFLTINKWYKNKIE